MVSLGLAVIAGFVFGTSVRSSIFLEFFIFVLGLTFALLRSGVIFLGGGLVIVITLAVLVFSFFPSGISGLIFGALAFLDVFSSGVVVIAVLIVPSTILIDDESEFCALQCE